MNAKGLLNKRFVPSLIVIIGLCFSPLAAFSQSDEVAFGKVKLLIHEGKSFKQKSISLVFTETSMILEARDGWIYKTWAYTDLESAEYSYSKHPRWKTALIIGAASLGLLYFIAIPIGFTKHRRHWLTIRTSDDFAVLKLSKKNRKMIIPTLEVKTGIVVDGLGEEK